MGGLGFFWIKRALRRGLYKEALKMDSKTARAHFGLGKLALGKVNPKQAIQEMTRATTLSASRATPA